MAMSVPLKRLPKLCSCDCIKFPHTSFTAHLEATGEYVKRILIHSRAHSSRAVLMLMRGGSNAFQIFVLNSRSSRSLGYCMKNAFRAGFEVVISLYCDGVGE